MALINDFLSLIYPRYCEACGENLYKHENLICNSCLISLPKGKYHLYKNSELEMVFAGRVPVAKALSLYVYQKCGRVQKILHAIKYHNQKELAAFLGELFARDLESQEILKGVDIIIPIPLHKNKLQARGYNQSEWFAKGLSEKLQIPLNTSILHRSIETSTQTKKKKYQRWENVDGIFDLSNAEQIAGQHILLVDDVITTGATLEAAWQAFKEVPDLKISIASIAFAGKLI